MGCCKLVGDKKNNKVFGQGNMTTNGDTPAGVAPTISPDTMSRIKDPSYKKTEGGTVAIKAETKKKIDDPVKNHN